MNQNYPDSDNNLTRPYIAEFLVNKLFHLYVEHNRYNLGENCGRPSFLEPGCGELTPFIMAVAKHQALLPLTTTAIEYREIENPLAITGVNFLDPKDDAKWRKNNNYDIIATNPPFSKGKVAGFINRSLELLHPQGFMGFFFALNFLASRERKKIYEKRPPYEITVMSHRPSFIRLYDDKKGTDQREYCFCIWGGLDIPVKLTKVSWTDIQDPDKRKKKPKR